MNWVTWFLFVGFLWISAEKPPTCKDDKTCKKLKKCLRKGNPSLVVPGNFNAVITNHCLPAPGNKDGCTCRRKDNRETESRCVVFLQRDSKKNLQKQWPRIQTLGAADMGLLYLSQWHKNQNVHLQVLKGRQCNAVLNCTAFPSASGNCTVTCLDIGSLCKQSEYDEIYCNKTDSQVNNKYIINMTATKKECVTCEKPVQKPEVKIDLSTNDISSDLKDKKEVSASAAAKLMNELSNIANFINTSSAEVTVGEGVSGVIVRETDAEDIEEVSFAYASPNESISIVNNKNSLVSYSRSVTVPKEAFNKSLKSNISIPFAAVFRFTNMIVNETDKTVLDEVLAIEMGALINNLTDCISINFKNVKYRGTPSCESWNGQGGQPNWTTDGCLTIQDGDNITCKCSHLTFFAVLLSPPNQTISSSDLNALTTITQAGCGLSIFFLSVILFRHFLMRKTEASDSTRLLIQLVSALLLLNFTFLINSFVADMKNSVGCKIMAAVMHYSMLATFTWFAVHAFHLCLQLYMRGKVVVRHYILKVSIASWVLPSLVGIILLILGKYGEQVIYTNDNEQNVTMCWITDSSIHYVVNIGYYALVFLFTFTTFIVIVWWLFCLKRTNAGNVQDSKSGKGIVTIMGLCCMLGIGWGCAFFAYGDLQIPAYYIFTILNSFQGFFLFIYYYNTSHSGNIHISGRDGNSNISSSSTNTLKTSLNSLEKISQRDMK